MRFWALIVAYFVIDGFSTVASARWVRGDGRSWLLAAFLGYTGCTTVWLLGLAQHDSPGFTKAHAIYPVIAMLMGIGAGLLVSGETLTRRDWFGATLGVVAVLVLALGEKPVN